MLRYCLTFLVFLFPALLHAQEKGAVVEAVEGQKYAILIGVNDYARLLKLRYAKNDIEALRDELLEIGFEKKNVYALTCGGATKDLPTKENINLIIEVVLEQAKEGDIIIVAMSGHGIDIEKQARFCPIDTNPENLPDTTIPINDIYNAFENSKATFKLMLVDACRENPFTTRSVAGASALQTLADPPAGVMLLQSSRQGQLSYEDPDLKRGIFTHYIVEGLQGKAADKEGKITLLGLADYATGETTRHALNQFRSRQQPTLRGELTNFVLATKGVRVEPVVPEENTPEFVSTYKDIFEAARGKSNYRMKGNSIDSYDVIFDTNVEDVKYLIDKKGARVNAKNEDGKTPLLIAALWADIEVVKYLISVGADVNAKDSNGWTPLETVKRTGYGDHEVGRYLSSLR